MLIKTLMGFKIHLIIQFDKLFLSINFDLVLIFCLVKKI